MKLFTFTLINLVILSTSKGKIVKEKPEFLQNVKINKLEVDGKPILVDSYQGFQKLFHSEDITSSPCKTNALEKLSVCINNLDYTRMDASFDEFMQSFESMAREMGWFSESQESSEFTTKESGEISLVVKCVTLALRDYEQCSMAENSESDPSISSIVLSPSEHLLSKQKFEEIKNFEKPTDKNSCMLCALVEAGICIVKALIPTGESSSTERYSPFIYTARGMILAVPLESEETESENPKDPLPAIMTCLKKAVEDVLKCSAPKVPVKVSLHPDMLDIKNKH